MESWIVKHSESKYAYNIIGDALGGEYKIARFPYLVTGNRVVDEINKAEALKHSTLAASAPEILKALTRIAQMSDLSSYEKAVIDMKQIACAAIEKATKI